MPRKYSKSKKEEWLAELAQGKTTKQIAKDHKIDERTLKRAASELYSRRAAQEAMAQLYQEALRGHMNRLNSALDMIINELQMPKPYVTELAWNTVASSRLSSRGSGEVSEGGRKISKQDEDVFSDTALLAEHLRNSKAWRALGDWRRTQRKHRTSCGMLQIRSIELLKEMTGLRVREERDVATKPFLHGENTGDLLCRTVVKYLSEGHDIRLVTKDIITDDHRGLVLHNNTVLVEGIKDTTKLSEYRDSIIKALDNLKRSPEVRQVINDFQRLQKILPNARNELQAIRMMGVLPGHCRVCRQFGL
jgi:hypothetical protein